MRCRPQLTVREPLKGTKSVQCQCDVRERVLNFDDDVCAWSARAPVCVNNSQSINSSSSTVVGPSKAILINKEDKSDVLREAVVSKVTPQTVSNAKDMCSQSAMTSNISEQVKSGSPDGTKVSNVGRQTLQSDSSPTLATPSLVIESSERMTKEEESRPNFSQTVSAPPIVPRSSVVENIIPLGTLHLVGETISNSSSCDAFSVTESSRSSQMETCSAMQRKGDEVRCNLYGGSIWLMCQVNGVRSPLLVDTGSAVTIFNDNFGSSVSECHVRAAVANGEQMLITGVAMMELRLGSEVIRVEVLVSPKVVDNVLGLDVMKKLRCSINLADMKLQFKGQALPLYTTPELTMIALVNGVMRTSMQSSELPEVITSQIPGYLKNIRIQQLVFSRNMRMYSGLNL
jgi:predicted aspartyl protease